MSDDTAARPRPPWTASPEEVEAFVRAHGYAYRPDVDGYQDPGPFAQRVKEGKNDPIYNAHSYHTKVPPRGIVPYLEHYTRPGDLVLDPFCGSGMTGVACLMTGRHAILNDLSPAATHIAYNYCTPVDVDALRTEFDRIKDAVKEEFDWLYGTSCDRGHPATIQYTIWSDVHQCRYCREDIVLWDAAVDHATGEVRGEFCCPKCGRGPWKKTELPLVRTDPVVTVYMCHGGCRTARGTHPTTAVEKARLAEIEAAEIPYWYPDLPFDQEREMWRGGHRDHGITRVADFWTKRNLWAVASLWEKTRRVDQHRTRLTLLSSLTAIMGVASKRNRWPQMQTMSGTLYIPALSMEMLVLSQFGRKVKAWIDAGHATQSSGTTVLVNQGPAQALPISQTFADYIFTDPPFGSNIFYADCSFLWEAWLGYFTDERFEAVWNKKRKPAQGGKSLEDYERLMGDAFREMHRVLKPGRWASVVFHNSDDRVWQAIQRAASQAGFEVVNALQLDKVQLSFKGTKGEKGEEDVTNKDLVLNLQKPSNGKTNGFSLAPDAEEVVADSILDHLSARPSDDERGLQAIQGLAIRSLVNRHLQVDVSWRSVRDVLGRLGCKEVDGRWYLPGDEVAAFSLHPTDEASAIAWVRRLLEGEGAMTRGEITPAFQQVTVGLKLKPLDRLLEENFVLDEQTNRWRLPTSADRERLNDANALRQRREITRLAEGRPARHYSDGELAELLAAAYRMGLYRAVLSIAQLVGTEGLAEDQRRVVAQLQELARLKLEAGGPAQLKML